MNEKIQSGTCPRCNTDVEKIIHRYGMFVRLSPDHQGPIPNVGFIAVCLKCGAVLEAIGHSERHSDPSASGLNWHIYAKPELYAKWIEKLAPEMHTHQNG